jgi:hypothetical protein
MNLNKDRGFISFRPSLLTLEVENTERRATPLVRRFNERDRIPGTVLINFVI